MVAQIFIAISENAPVFARCYAALVESLVREGVPDHIARSTATQVLVNIILNFEFEDSDNPFPE